MLGSIGLPELTVVLALVLIVFGAGKLPEIGAGMGKAIKNFKKATTEVDPPQAAKNQQIEEKEKKDA